MLIDVNGGYFTMDAPLNEVEKDFAKDAKAKKQSPGSPVHSGSMLGRKRSFLAHL